MKYFIKTFGCQQNKADSERIAQTFKNRGMSPAKGYKDTNYVIINTCMVRESAENRVYGLIENLAEIKEQKQKKNQLYKIIVTGCMVGLAYRDKTGKYFQKIRSVMPEVDEFMPIEEVGFDHQPIRQDRENAWVPISNGCNNFCTFCVVPFTRGREISRPYKDIIDECLHLKAKGYKTVTLLGQNVNSYGADLLVGEKNIQVMRDIDKTYFIKKTPGDARQGTPKTASSPVESQDDAIFEAGERQVPLSDEQMKPIYVKHLGRYRIPTLFPYLLDEIALIGFEKVDFVSSNPWDFSDELIDVIAKNKNITRLIHLPIQAGDDNMLKRMNRWYSTKEYLTIIDKLRSKVSDIKFTTDIIVGFCNETEEEFNHTVELCKKVGYERAFISIYSQRPMTAATKVLTDNVPHPIKKKRWQTLENLINKPHLKVS